MTSMLEGISNNECDVMMIIGLGRNPNEPTQSFVIPVANDMAGQIIGKGGATIRNIRERSGCTIKIADSVPGQLERAITITGSISQNERYYTSSHILESS
jgi:polyribonucleotide nucleotidyltransferase